MNVAAEYSKQGERGSACDGNSGSADFREVAPSPTDARLEFVFVCMIFKPRAAGS
jgi:hypothetical protein